MDANPDPGSLTIVTVILIAAAIILTAFVTAADKAVECVNRNEIRDKASDGDRKAARLVRLFDRSENFNSAVTVTTVFMLFAAGAATVKTPVFSMRGLFGGSAAGNFAADLLLIMLASCVFLVLAIVFPRQIALKHPEGTALRLSGWAVMFTVLCVPFASAARSLVRLLLFLTRQGMLVPDEQFSEEEVLSMLEVGREQGDINEEGTKMINSIFEFDDKLAYEIMTPRTDVFAIDIDDDPVKYMERFMEMRYSRIPVYEGDMDNIIGILNIKDYLVHAYNEGFDNVRIGEFLRDAMFVPETKKIDSLFKEMQLVSQHIAVLIDEYGGFAGVVTMEDILEEIVGDIDDEYDEEAHTIKQVDKNKYIVTGMINIGDFNEEFGTHLESDNNETISGMIIDELGEIPEEDSQEPRTIVIDGCLFTILSVSDRRISGFEVSLPDSVEVEKIEE